ncbi:MAG: hypothetical protein GX496_02685 [Firmicutes bacterium]|nr:hypothetical protein [Bacillota bacterium]
MRVLGFERRVRTRHLGPGTLRVGKRRFWVEDVEVVVRYSLPVIWEPGPAGMPPSQRPRFEGSR